MLEISALTYGLVTSVVLSSIGRNHREKKPNPALLNHLGYLLCGISGATSLLLGAVAVRQYIG